MVYTETSSTSWLGRIKNALAGIIIGFILFIAGFPLLWWNEGRSVSVYKTLSEVRTTLLTINDNSKIDPANDGKLVHVSGDTGTPDVLKDAAFNISENAIRLRRSSEIYQYKERVETRKKKKLGGGEETVKEYHYDKIWAEKPIDSQKFKDPDYRGKNRGDIPYPSMTFNAKNVNLAAFKLNDSLISDISNFEKYNASSGELPPNLPSNTSPHNGGYYLGNAPSSPEIGDVRISFTIVRPSNASVIAQQVGQTFEKYISKATGRHFEMLKVGIHSADSMIDQKEQENKLMTWLLRAGGIFAMFLGLIFLFKPLSVLGDIVPFIGNLIGSASAVIAGILAIMFGSMTIGAAWVAYRPLIGIPLLAITLGCIVMLFMRKKKNVVIPSAVSQAPPPPPPPA